jgi:hypothetical protein
VCVIFRNLCLNIFENACNRAFLTPRSVQGYSRGRQKSVGCVLSLETLVLNISENACNRAFLTPRSVQGYSRGRQKRVGCALSLETLIPNISENACSRAFLTPRSVQGYSRGQQKSAGCVLSEIFTEFTELIDISRSRVKIMLEVAVGGVEQRLGNLALGPEL